MDSASETKPTAAARLLGWVIASPLTALTVAGLVLYGSLRLDYSLFYSRFGLRPEDVGLGYAEILSQSVVGLVIYVLLYFAMLLYFNREIDFARTMLRMLFRRTVFIPALVAAILVFVSVRFLRLAATTVASILLGVMVASIVPDLMRRELRKPQARASPAPESKLEASGDHVAIVDPPVRRAVFRIILPVAAVFVLVLTPIEAVEDAGYVLKGQPRHQTLLGLPLLSWGADPASILSVAGPLPTDLQQVTMDCLMYLGQANGISLLYDVHSRQTVRIPSTSVVITVRPNQSSCEGRR
jgi:hypothetical protein